MTEAAARAGEDHLRLIRKLESVACIGPQERAVLAALPLRLRHVRADTDLIVEGQPSTECCVVLDGYFCRYVILGHGQRQILAFHIPGDFLDLQGLHLQRQDHNISALTDGRVGFIPHACLEAAMERHPALVHALWRDTLVDAAVFRQWLASAGRRAAHQRVAHLLCELSARLAAVGLARPGEFELPLTQAEIGDALGLSSVHVNRVLQDLRRDGLIVSRGRMLRIPDLPRLQDVGDFDPAYLHFSDLRRT